MKHDRWTPLPWQPEEHTRPFVTDDRRQEPARRDRCCAVCETQLGRRTPEDVVTCEPRHARCRYSWLAAQAGVALPNSPTPMIVRPEPVTLAPPMLVIGVPSLFEIAARVAA
jgi:hypothetical protein